MILYQYRQNLLTFCMLVFFFYCHLLIFCIGVAPITELRTYVIKKGHIQWRSPKVVSDFPYLKELLLKERIRSLWEQTLSCKRSSHFEKGTQLKRITACFSSLPLMCVTFSVFWLHHCFGSRIPSNCQAFGSRITISYRPDGLCLLPSENSLFYKSWADLKKKSAYMIVWFVFFTWQSICRRGVGDKHMSCKPGVAGSIPDYSQ